MYEGNIKILLSRVKPKLRILRLVQDLIAIFLGIQTPRQTAIFAAGHGVFPFHVIQFHIK